MGMPISLALRGRHADDDAGARRLGGSVMAVLREVDVVFSTYRPTPSSPGSAGARSPWTTAHRRWPRCWRWARLAERESGGAFERPAPGPDGAVVLDPSGVVKGWAVERGGRHLRALAGTDFCLSAGGDLVCRTLDPDGPPWRIGIEDPHDPPGWSSPSCRCTRGGGHLGHRPPRASTSSTPAPAGHPPASPR